MIELVNLSKQYGSRKIVNNCSFKFPDKGIYCLHGENGSGKSTVLGMIAGAILPDTGKILINGVGRSSQDLSHKKIFSYVPDSCPIYPFITGEEFLNFIQSIRKSPSDIRDHLINIFNIKSYLASTFSEMSLGTAKKFMLIAALMVDSQVLVMDEPTNGLDVQSVKVLEDLILNLCQDRLILMACHDEKVRKKLNAKILDINLFR
ncbi:ABC transporter ATP-binding protein [Acinetobacter oleivorans]|uniref:ATP-binding cassette domain-containing protein n=1 Tax=Acinetobacter oleivorans TaxID=1148157 RepID=UPI0019023540|nr:ABC transporter ATP-binding protein [Acinetobacter oleivorans]MBJ9739612.1 ABC transporter ATP-binding protein [Acinetobacter oleivorans]MCU4411974.1 ABC transporter ATP-binding protein [Acinetobacter oleivorans]